MTWPAPAAWSSTAEVSLSAHAIPPGASTTAGRPHLPVHDNNNNTFPQGTTCTNLDFSAVFGPAATTWYKFLAKNVNLKSPNGTILARVALDQGVFAPVFIGVFLSSMATLEGNPVKEKLDKNYKTALTSNYMLWPFVQAVNFKVVPLEHRVLFVNVISIGWNCYLSYLNSS